MEHFIVEKKLIDSSSTHGTNIGGSCFIQKPKLLEHPFAFVPDNVLTVGCQLIWRIHNELLTTFPALANPFPVKANSFEKFFNQPKFNDLKIIVGDTKFYGSKLLLSEASDVFQDKVENLPQSAANSIEVNDVDVKAFENVLRFIHYKAIPDLQLSADTENWLKIADKFHLHRLKVNDKRFSLVSTCASFHLLLCIFVGYPSKRIFPSIRTVQRHNLSENFSQILRCWSKIEKSGIHPKKLDRIGGATQHWWT